MAAEALSLYTIPSNYVRALCAPTPKPYERVVGVRRDSSHILWAGHNGGDPEGAFNPNDATEVRIDSTDRFNRNFRNFYERYVANPNPPHGYNCHRFAYAMEGHANANLPFVSNADDVLGLRVEPADGGLDLGAHGLVGKRYLGYPASIHSVVGLGRGRADCIQVMAADYGHVALASYEDTLARLDHPSYHVSPDHSDFGLHVRLTMPSE